ncbi:protein of unknown function (plasmid) [Caballeronia sp. S22]
MFDRNRLLSLLPASAEVLYPQGDENHAEHRSDGDGLRRADRRKECGAAPKENEKGRERAECFAFRHCRELPPA